MRRVSSARQTRCVRRACERSESRTFAGGESPDAASERRRRRPPPPHCACASRHVGGACVSAVGVAESEAVARQVASIACSVTLPSQSPEHDAGCGSTSAHARTDVLLVSMLRRSLRAHCARGRSRRESESEKRLCTPGTTTRAEAQQQRTRAARTLRQARSPDAYRPKAAVAGPQRPGLQHR